MTRNPDQAVRWGILGAGGISSAFTADLRANGHTVQAVGARSGESARAFAERFELPRAHAGYQALLADDEVDIVYIGTPQGLHEEQARAALAAGKPVLVEKSFTADAPSAERLAAAAQDAGLFAMEAMWTRFLPPMVELRRRVAAGELGELRQVVTSHHQAIRPGPGSRHLDPALGGGALLDLGVYGVSFAIELLGAPSRIAVEGRMLAPGIDAGETVLMRHPLGRSVTDVSIDTAAPARAVVVGSEGSIEFEPFWFTWSGFTAYDGGRPAAVVDRVPGGPAVRALHFQAAEAERCLREGLLESPVMPLAQSVLVMQTLDAIRDALGDAGI